LDGAFLLFFDSFFFAVRVRFFSQFFQTELTGALISFAGLFFFSRARIGVSGGQQENKQSSTQQKPIAKGSSKQRQAKKGKAEAERAGSKSKSIKQAAASQTEHRSSKLPRANAASKHKGKRRRAEAPRGKSSKQSKRQASARSSKGKLEQRATTQQRGEQ
jgi:hypothetical protein